MKAAIRLLILFAMCLAAGAASAQSYAIQLSWTNTDTGNPACSGTVTKTCIKARTMTDVTVSTAPVVLSSTILPTATTYTTPTLTYTAQITRLYTLVTNYFDASGAAQVSGNATCAPSGTTAPCSVPVFIVLPPSNLTATPVTVSELVEPEQTVGMM